MLQIYVDQYKEAVRRGETETAARIAKELGAFGLDRFTLLVVAYQDGGKEAADNVE